MKAKTKAVLNNDYLIYSDDKDILIELILSDDTINWHNFNNESLYFTENDEVYTVKDIDTINKTLKLERY